MSRLGLLANPTSGGGRGARVGARTAHLLRAAGHDVVPVTGRVPGAAPTAPGVAGLDALVVVGGDGTVHAGLQVTAGTPLPLGVVPAGSGDDVARSLGVPRATDAAVAELLRALAADGGPRRVDAVRVGPARDGDHLRSPDGPRDRAQPRDGAGPRDLAEPRDPVDPRDPVEPRDPADPRDREDRPAAAWYAGVLSCGFDAAVNARANAMRWPTGRARYLRGVAAELRSFVPYGYRLTLDDAVWDSAGTLVAVANAPRFGGGIAIAPDARMTDGLLDVLVAGPFTRRGVLAVLPGAYRGRHVRHPAVQVLRTRSVLVEADPRLGAAPPVAFADGERLGPLPLRATVVPGALAVLA